MSLIEIAAVNAVLASALMLLAVLANRGGRLPRLAHALWILALLKLLTPPLVHVPLWPRDLTPPHRAESTAPLPPPAPDAAASPVAARPGLRDDRAVLEGAAFPLAGGAAPTVARPPSGPLLPRSRPWRVAIQAAWAAGALTVLGLAGIRAGRFERYLRSASPGPARLREAVGRLARRLGLARAPEVRVIGARMTPCVWAPLGRPRLVVPAGLIFRLGAAELDTLLLHELAHVRRGDHWVRRLELACGAAFWWLPTFWWARPRLRAAEESCCDGEVVAALCGEGRTYAAALVDAMDYLAGAPRTVPAAASGLDAGPAMKRRVMMILNDSGGRPLPVAMKYLLVLGAALVLPFAPGPGHALGQEAPVAALADVLARIDGEPVGRTELLDLYVAHHRDYLERVIRTEKLARRLLLDHRLRLTAEEIEAKIATQHQASGRREGDEPTPREREAARRAAYAAAAWDRILRHERELPDDRPIEHLQLQMFIQEKLDQAEPIEVGAEERRQVARNMDGRTFAATLELLIDARLIERERVRHGIADPAAEVEEWNRAQSERHPPPFNWEAICRMKGTTPGAEAVRRRQKIIARGLLGGPPAEPHLRSFFERHREAFLGGSRKVSQIRAGFGPGDPSGRTESEASKRILSLYREIGGGADFSELAKTASDDPTTARGGGRLARPIRSLSSDLPPEFVDAVMKLERAGDISRPIRTSDAWLLVRLDEIVEGKPWRGSTPDPLDDPRFGEWVLDEAESARLRHLAADLRRAARIEIVTPLSLD